MLDAALQMLGRGDAGRIAGEARPKPRYLPVSFETIRVFGEVGRRARCHAEVTDLDDDGAGKLGRVILMDDAGNSDRRDHRHLPAARATPHGAIAADAEDLRHHLGGNPDPAGPEPAAAAPTEAGWC